MLFRRHLELLKSRYFTVRLNSKVLIKTWSKHKRSVHTRLQNYERTMHRVFLEIRAMEYRFGVSVARKIFMFIPRVNENIKQLYSLNFAPNPFMLIIATNEYINPQEFVQHVLSLVNYWQMKKERSLISNPGFLPQYTRKQDLENSEQQLEAYKEYPTTKMQLAAG